MRRTQAWAGAVACGVAVAAAACNGTASRPTAVPVDNDDRPTTPGPKPKKVTKPAQSEPAAEAAIDKLLKAHTGGKTGLVGQLKAFKSVRKGRFEGPGPA